MAESVYDRRNGDEYHVLSEDQGVVWLRPATGGARRAWSLADFHKYFGSEWVQAPAPQRNELEFDDGEGEAVPGQTDAPQLHSEGG